MNLDIVLFEPEIPQNTGNIARTCVAIGARLHLVGHLGFSLEDRYLKRAGLDYWFDLDLTLWDSLDEFQAGWHRLAGGNRQAADGASAADTVPKPAAVGPGPAARVPGPAAAVSGAVPAFAEAGIYYATTRARAHFAEVAYPERTALVFGPESRGLPAPLLQARPERCIRIPMREGNRSLNLSNAVAIIAYEVMRQNGYPGLR